MRTASRPKAVAEILLDPAMAGIVDLCAWSEGATVRVAGHHGQVSLSADGTVLDVVDANPLADSELYPNAAESICQIFDSPCAPDLAISHHPSHHKYEIGDHGSLRAVHTRAPFIAAGPGIANDWRVERSLRMIDVAPTVAQLLGAELPHADGMPDHDLLTGEQAASVVMFLLDGTNLAMLHQVMDDGRTPAISSVAERGTSYLGGALASFPTVTLANHTTILTGLHPGHSGVLGNLWHDREAGVTHDLLEQQELMRASRHLAPGVETLHHAVKRARPDAFTTSTFEYCDAGADWSSFAEVREGRRKALPVRSRGNRHLNPAHAHIDWYRRMSVVDASSTADAVAFYESDQRPDFMFVNFSLTDETGHHAGPFAQTTADAIAETDARVGEVLSAIESAGHLDTTAIVILADHGMGDCDPANNLVLSDHLASQGIDAIVTEETFVYLQS